MKTDPLAIPEQLTTYSEFQAYARKLATAFKRGELSELEWETRHDVARDLFDRHEKQNLLADSGEIPSRECHCGATLHYKDQKKSPAGRPRV